MFLVSISLLPCSKMMVYVGNYNFCSDFIVIAMSGKDVSFLDLSCLKYVAKTVELSTYHLPTTSHGRGRRSDIYLTII